VHGEPTCSSFLSACVNVAAARIGLCVWPDPDFSLSFPAPLGCATQNYCQLLQVTMTTTEMLHALHEETRRRMCECVCESAGQWRFDFAQTQTHTSTPTPSYPHPLTHTHSSRGIMMVVGIVVAQIFVDNGCENWRRVIAFAPCQPPNLPTPPTKPNKRDFKTFVFLLGQDSWKCR